MLLLGLYNIRVDRTYQVRNTHVKIKIYVDTSLYAGNVVPLTGVLREW